MRRRFLSNLFPNFEVRMTYNIRFKDKLQREQKHRHRNFKSIFTHRHRLGDIDVKNIDNRKQTFKVVKSRRITGITRITVFFFYSTGKRKVNFYLFIFFNIYLQNLFSKMKIEHPLDKFEVQKIFKT